MSDEPNTPPNEPSNSSADPTGSLADAAAASVQPPENPKEVLAKELSPEHLKQVDRAISQAIDGYQRKHEEKFAEELEKKGWSSPEQVKEMVQAEVQLAETKAQAKMNINNWMTNQGIDPTSEDGKAVFNEYKEGLEAGRYTNRMLLDEKGVKYLVHAAGLAPTTQPTSEFEPVPTSVPMSITSVNDDGSPLTRAQMDAKVREQAQETVKQYQSQRRGR
jgi:hypothetical protein